MFHDRTDAGKQLGSALTRYRGPRTLILGIPRGGVAVAFPVAEALAAPFSILVVRKLPYPDFPESGFGAVAEDGAMYFVAGAGRGIPQAVVDRVILREQAEVIRRVRDLRNGRPLPDLTGHDVILVDDGIAMGSTAHAAILCCRDRGARRVILAAPVASPDALLSLRTTADETVVLLAPPVLRAVADFYEQWNDVPDSDVVDTMRRAEAAGLLAAPMPPRTSAANYSSRRAIASAPPVHGGLRDPR